MLISYVPTVNPEISLITDIPWFIVALYCLPLIVVETIPDAISGTNTKIVLFSPTLILFTIDVTL